MKLRKEITMIDRRRLLCISKKAFKLNGYEIRVGELVDVTHVNEEVGVKTMVRFIDRFGNPHVMEMCRFGELFDYDCEI